MSIVVYVFAVIGLLYVLSTIGMIALHGYYCFSRKGKEGTGIICVATGKKCPYGNSSEACDGCQFYMEAGE